MGCPPPTQPTARRRRSRAAGSSTGERIARRDAMRRLAAAIAVVCAAGRPGPACAADVAAAGSRQASATRAASGTATRDAVMRALGLTRAERTWLAGLGPREIHALADALSRPAGPVDPRTLDLIARIVGSRSRWFAYVGYPPVSDTRQVCDGLVRE